MPEWTWDWLNYVKKRLKFKDKDELKGLPLGITYTYPKGTLRQEVLPIACQVHQVRALPASIPLEHTEASPLATHQGMRVDFSPAKIRANTPCGDLEPRPGHPAQALVPPRWLSSVVAPRGPAGDTVLWPLASFIAIAYKQAKTCFS